MNIPIDIIYFLVYNRCVKERGKIMKIKQVFDVYEDAGHAWMKVKKDLLHKMGIADKITAYSYERGEYAYLEEDCDLTTFYNRYKDMYGVDIKFRRHYSDTSRIRGYNDYNYSRA